MPTSYYRGHARTVPSWGTLPLGLAAFAGTVAAVAALTAVPSLALGLVAGVFLWRTVRPGYRAVRRGATTVNRTFERLDARGRARLLERGEGR